MKSSALKLIPAPPLAPGTGQRACGRARRPSITAREEGIKEADNMRLNCTFYGDRQRRVEVGCREVLADDQSG